MMRSSGGKYLHGKNVLRRKYTLHAYIVNKIVENTKITIGPYSN